MVRGGGIWTGETMGMGVRTGGYLYESLRWGVIVVAKKGSKRKEGGG